MHAHVLILFFIFNNYLLSSTLSLFNLLKDLLVLCIIFLLLHILYML